MWSPSTHVAEFEEVVDFKCCFWEDQKAECSRNLCVSTSKFD